MYFELHSFNKALSDCNWEELTTILILFRAT